MSSKSNSNVRAYEFSSFKQSLWGGLAVLFMMLTFVSVSKAEIVYETHTESRADVKVFVVTTESRADLIVYTTHNESRAKNSNNPGIWFFTNTESRAKKKICFVNTESRADLKVYFTNTESRAGWRKFK